ncbi:type II CRISPR RNA-guided endonuclease Cas9 [Microvirga sp. W0021]|uniref:CRISPR-associated endonuclease Cas9 n=1 Tax=Hohaiivirga grylli TaxID=3133970 RepID=A0ABV0BI44_9HYPH
MGLRFSFDMGTNSIGWAVWRTGLDELGVFGKDAPKELLQSGVRIFKDGRNPKDGSSLAEMRRIPRQARRRRDRFVQRRDNLLKALIAEGFMPEQELERKQLASLDPYLLRAKGLNEPLTASEMGRILFHINQRRGFKSNRKADRKNSENGVIAEGAKRLTQALIEQGSRTYGEFLWTRQRGQGGDSSRPRDPERLPTRIRMDGQGASALYEFYPTREMMLHEFHTLWGIQQSYNPAVFKSDLREKIEKIIFYQRPLKPPKIGRCTFVSEDFRTPKALPSVQEREMLERLNHIRLLDAAGYERPLTLQERDVLASALRNTDKMTFKGLRKGLKLGGDIRINFEETGEKHLSGCVTNKILSKPDHFGPRWNTLPLEDKDAFITKLLQADDDDALIIQLMKEYGLDHEHAEACATIPLPEGYSRLGSTANTAILDALTHEVDERGFVISYAEAVKRAGWHHSDERTGEIWQRLPYYGQVLQRHIIPGSMDPIDKKKDKAAYWGRISNPTVHIGLNQLRRLVNALIIKFGHPDQVVIELAREFKLSQRQKEELQKTNRRNRDANEARRKRMEGFAEFTGANMSRMKLFEAQMVDGVVQCPFSGRVIPLSKLYTSEIEIEHILPWSRTLDDGNANKVLCYRDMNRIKRGKSPFEAFGNEPQWPDILARAAALPKEKRWRFYPDAMDVFTKKGDFLDRQLNETQYLSRLAKTYLGCICDPTQVYVTPGRLIGLLRGKWGLNGLLGNDNQKNRTDHRHHAIDAIVIGAMTRGILQTVAREAGKAEQQEHGNIIGRIPEPFDNFRHHIRESVESITVSHKSEQGKSGALHEDTAYGFIHSPAEAAEIGNLVRRKPLVDLTAGEVDRIRDPKHRLALQERLAGLRDAKGKVRDSKELMDILKAYAAENGIRRIRIGKEDKSAYPIKDKKSHEVYKAVIPGENHHIDVVQMRDGKWECFAASIFEVNQKDWRPLWEREKLGGKLVMRLHKGDMVQIQDADGSLCIKTVIRLQPSSNTIRLVPHNEGGVFEQRHNDDADSFRWDFASISRLKERQCHKIKVDVLGDYNLP